MRYCNCFYCKHFTEFRTNRHLWYLPFRELFYKIWFFIPLKIRAYNEKECEYRVPDWINFDGTLGIKIKPFLGYVFRTEEGEAISLAWWKYLVRIKK